MEQEVQQHHDPNTPNLFVSSETSLVGRALTPVFEVT